MISGIILMNKSRKSWIFWSICIWVIWDGTFPLILWTCVSCGQVVICTRIKLLNDNLTLWGTDALPELHPRRACWAERFQKSSYSFSRHQNNGEIKPTSDRLHNITLLFHRVVDVQVTNCPLGCFGVVALCAEQLVSLHLWLSKQQAPIIEGKVPAHVTRAAMLIGEQPL